MVYGIENAFNLYLKKASTGRRPAIICIENTIEDGLIDFSWHYRSNYSGQKRDVFLSHLARLALEKGCTDYSEAIGRNDLRKIAARMGNAEEQLPDN